MIVKRFLENILKHSGQLSKQAESASKENHTELSP